MSDRACSKQVRLALGFLLAPAIVPIAHVAILFGLYGLGSENAGILLAMAWPDLLYIGLAISYGGAVVAGAPWVACKPREGHPGFRAVMFLPAALAAIFALLAGAVLPFVWYPGLPALFAYCLTYFLVPVVPAILLSGLCFYCLAFWRSPQSPARQSGTEALAASRKDPRL